MATSSAEGPAPACEPPSPAVGGYRPGRRLDRGPLNEVYEADCPGSPGSVVIELRRGATALDPANLQACRSEVALTGHLRHPHIAPLRALGATADGVPYLVREYLDGETLECHLAQRGQLTATEVVALVKQIAAAVSAAHGVGVVHGDLRPSKVLLTQEGTFVKLIGFGLWRPRRHHRRLAATPVIDACSWPAGINRSAELEPAADQFSLAAIAHRALTGLGIPSAEDGQRSPGPPADIAGCHAAAEAVIRGALANPAAGRFAGVSQFAVALEQAVAGVFPAGEPPSSELDGAPSPPLSAVELPFDTDGEVGESCWGADSKPQ
jgi:serine/threonine protein kinase